MRNLHGPRQRSGVDGSWQIRCAASNLANALWLQDALADALSWARWAIRQSAPIALGNGKSVCREVKLGDGVESVEWVHPTSWRCLGNVLLDLGCFREAMEAYQLADPAGTDSATRFNQSKALLGLGCFEEAWSCAEARLTLQPPPSGVLPGPHWDAWSQSNHVWLWSEQGLGDTLQFVRWLPALLATGVKVTLGVQAPLLTLLQQGLRWLGPQLEVVLHPLEGGVVGSAPALEGVCHGSLLSLPWRLQEPQPPWPAGRRQGYLQLPPSVRPGSAADPPSIGLLWGSGRYLDGHGRERDYRRKSVLGTDLQALLQGLAQRPLQLWNLQVGPDREQGNVEKVPWAGALAPDADFLGLAQCLQQLDLLICVDTAAAHLAGAMGLEAWVLLPWAAASRWQRHSSTTLWYPSLRLWRQPRHGDWLGLWPELLAALDQRLASRSLNSAS